MRRAGFGVAALLAATALGQVLTAQVAPETFTAKATVTKGGASASVPLSVSITRYSSGDERDAVMAAVRAGGTTGVRAVLAAMPDAGFVQLGERRTPIKFVGQRPTGSGRLVTVVTADPILFLGASMPQSAPRAGFDVAVALLDLNDRGGKGELAPAAKVGLDPNGALLIEDYGATVVWLNELARAR